MALCTLPPWRVNRVNFRQRDGDAKTVIHAAYTVLLIRAKSRACRSRDGERSVIRPCDAVATGAKFYQDPSISHVTVQPAVD